MNTKKIIFPLLILAISFLAGCIGQWQNPNAAIPSQEIKISNLLIFPNAYDRAGVILKGKVWDLDFVEDKDNPDEVYSTFKLADEDGNYVIVRSPGMTTLLQEGVMIKVIGLHRVIYDKDSRLISNHIEAKQIIL